MFMIEIFARIATNWQTKWCKYVWSFFYYNVQTVW